MCNEILEMGNLSLHDNVQQEALTSAKHKRQDKSQARKEEMLVSRRIL
jgi:hypothetical protein